MLSYEPVSAMSQGPASALTQSVLSVQYGMHTVQCSSARYRYGTHGMPSFMVGNAAGSGTRPSSNSCHCMRGLVGRTTSLLSNKTAARLSVAPMHDQMSVPVKEKNRKDYTPWGVC